MAKEEFFNNGSRWLRADFHLHTKSDTEFKRFTGTDSEFTSQSLASHCRKAAQV